MQTAPAPPPHGADAVPAPDAHRAARARSRGGARPRAMFKAMPRGIYVRLPATARDLVQAAARQTGLSAAAWIRGVVVREVDRPGAARPTPPRLPPPPERVRAMVDLQAEVSRLGLAMVALLERPLPERGAAGVSRAELEGVLDELRSVSDALVRRILRSPRGSGRAAPSVPASEGAPPP